MIKQLIDFPLESHPGKLHVHVNARDPVLVGMQMTVTAWKLQFG